MDAMQVLVVILSIFLAVFLMLAIVLIYQLLKVTRQIRRIADTTETTVEGFSNLVNSATKLVSPALLAGIISKQFKRFTKNKSKKEDK